MVVNLDKCEFAVVALILLCVWKKGRKRPNKNGNERILYTNVMYSSLTHAVRTHTRIACKSFFFADAKHNTIILLLLVLLLLFALCIFISKPHSNEVQFVVRFQLDHTKSQKSPVIKETVFVQSKYPP